MILTLLTGKERKPRPCIYELAKEGRLCQCGAPPPVAKVSMGGLCLEHAEYALVTADCECRDHEKEQGVGARRGCRDKLSIAPRLAEAINVSEVVNG